MARRRLLIAAVVTMALVAWWGSAIALVGAWRLAGEIDRATEIARLSPHAQATVVFDRHNQPVFSFYLEQRIDVPVDQVSPHMINAILVAEDRRFYSHHGLDGIRIVKAAWRNWRAGRIVEGGSTITQQLARAEQLTPARTFTRKIREAVLAARLEERYSKSEILGAYLNTVYFGDGYYGVEAASRGYFGKSASALEPHEAALLAALVRSPSGYSPARVPARALARRNLVLRLMRDALKLTDAEYRAAIHLPFRANSTPAVVTASDSIDLDACGQYFQEEVRRELTARFGGQQVREGGLRVFTGYDPQMQCEGERAIAARIAQIVKLRPRARDLQGSLVAIDPASGEVRAIVGGRDFAASSFNRATQARRQPGSAFKPIIYAAALEQGYAPGSVLRHLDEPIMTATGPWLPGGEHEQPEYTLRSALKISSNRAAAQLLQQVGLGVTELYAQRLGIESNLPSVPSLALGTGGVTLLELTSAYGVFANQGMAVAPHLVGRVEDRQGRTLWDARPARRRALTETTAFLMSSMLADVIQSGTATPVRATGFTLPAAGKTGTTDDYADAWFVGYTPRLVAGVWFGMDRPRPIMNRGFASIVAAPAWGRFMKTATAGDPPSWYDTPADVEIVAVCRLSGKLATDACRHDWRGPDYVAAGLTDLPGEQMAPGFDRAASASTPEEIKQAMVFEDYVPVGSMPSDICDLHGSAPLGIDGAVGTTPADSGFSVRPASSVQPIGTSGSTAPPTRLHVERVPRADGTTHFIIKQR
jgi:1A family penicillin-binding protein